MSTQNERHHMSSTLDQAIMTLEQMSSELMKASYTKDNYNSTWGQTLELISNSLNKHASQLKYKKHECGDFNHV